MKVGLFIPPTIWLFFLPPFLKYEIEMGIFLFFSLKGSSLPSSPEKKRNYLASAHDSENSLKLSFYLSNRSPNEWEKRSGVSM